MLDLKLPVSLEVMKNQNNKFRSKPNNLNLILINSKFKVNLNSKKSYTRTQDLGDKIYF